MGPLVIVVLVGVTIVIATRSIRGTLTDRHSLEEHHRALDTLGEVTHQQEGATALPSDSPGARAHVRIVGTERPVPPAPKQTGRRGVAARAVVPPLVMPPSATTGPARTSADANAARAAHRDTEPARAAQRDTEPAPSATRPEPAGIVGLGSVARRPRSTGPRHRRRGTLVSAGAVVLAAAVVVVTGLELAAVFGRSDRNHPPAAAIAVPAATVPVPSTTATTKTTAVPAVLVSRDSQGAHYNIVASATVELVSSSPCWVQIRAGNATGPLVFQGLLRPGDRRPIPATAPTWLRLGNPAGLAIVVNGAPLQPPGLPSSQPYNFTFAPTTNG